MLSLRRTAKLIALPFFILSLSACSSLLYYPTRIKYSDPRKMGVEYKELEFESLDGTKLVGWFIPSTKKTKGTIVQFHGNGENISSHVHSLLWLSREGYEIFTFDYRGYGGSHGEPNPKGVHQDAVAALRFVNSGALGHRPQQLILYGQSLGGAVLLGALKELKERSPIKLVIIEGSFMSYQGIARRKMSDLWLTWIFQPLAYLFFSDKYSGKDQISEISPIPLLVIHGSDDHIIPIEEGRKIFEKAREPKYFLEVQGGHHIDLAYHEGGRLKPVLLENIERMMEWKSP